MREIEVFDNAADFLKAQKSQRGTRRHQTSGAARKTPRALDATGATLSGAHSEPGLGDMHDALERIAVYRYMPRFRTGIGFDFFSPYDPTTTTPHATYHAAVAAAEQELGKR